MRTYRGSLRAAAVAGIALIALIVTISVRKICLFEKDTPGMPPITLGKRERSAVDSQNWHNRRKRGWVAPGFCYWSIFRPVEPSTTRK